MSAGTSRASDSTAGSGNRSAPSADDATWTSSSAPRTSFRLKRTTIRRYDERRIATRGTTANPRRASRRAQHRPRGGDHVAPRVDAELRDGPRRRLRRGERYRPEPPSLGGPRVGFVRGSWFPTWRYFAPTVRIR